MKKICLLGSTGSIGTQCLDVCSGHPEEYRVTCLACGTNIEKLEQQILDHRPEVVVVRREEDARKLAEDHPEIPTHSAAAEKKLAEAEEAEKKKYLQELSPEAERSVENLRSAQDYLDRNPDLSRQLAYAAREKRTIDRINPTYQIFAVIIVLAAAAAVAFGIWAMLNRKGWAVYFVLFGFAFIFLVSATRILPTAGRNRRSAQRDWDQALSEMRAFVSEDPEFPIPAQYAHPIVLERMIRAIRMGRAVTVSESLTVVKEDLKALNSQVKVSQKEYDEVVAVKPLFLVMNYE